ncbi:fasciclin domain-containing protein [uncultured Algibacter sp.]|uniref:fasciclin domain-containing protein n=1 Tax=uncultured Algibacter sp. TaxID=298659 RepID=UPI002617D77D|nr:fasciclin domain-containing protein [uncultured Algibacter sp.]
MKNLNPMKKFAIILFSVLTITSCSNDDDDSTIEFEPTNSIVELAQATPELSSLVTALVKYPDLVDLLSGNGTYTVFAPNNTAFADLLGAIGQTSIDDIPEDVLKSVLQHHVFASAALEASDVTSGTITMAGGETVDVVADSNGVFIDSAQVIAVDGLATNGVVHVINSVLVPPSMLPIVGTIVAPAYFNKNFTTLIEAVLAADPSILELLLSNGPGDSGLTLFAPTNDAFTAAGITDLADVADIVDTVLAYHVVDGTIMQSMLPDSGIAAAEVSTLGGNIYITNAGGAVSINGTTMVTATDITGSNGVVHVIDRTLIPPTNTINDIVASLAGGNPAEFTMLAAALAQAGLGDTFGTAGPFTVFAPTDAAFMDAGFANVDAINATDASVLVAILTHHVVEPSVYIFSTDLTDDLQAPMLNGQNVTIDLDTLTIQDAAGSTPAGLVTSLLNVHATNGVVHVIDKVLLPSN